MATYYLSNTGSNSNNGTSEATPWQTIAKIISTPPVAGDTVLFKKGDIWREQLTLPSSGSSGSPITYGAYGSGAKPIINAANVVTGWTNSSGNQWWINNPNAVTTRAMVVVNNVIYAEVASLAALTSANQYFIDTSATPDRVYIYSTVDPNTLTTEVSAREYCIASFNFSRRSFIDIEDIEVRYAGRGGIYLEGNGTAFDGSCNVRRCVAYANRLFGMVHIDRHDNVLFEDCEASYNGNGFYSWIASGGTFRRCVSNDSIQYDVTFTDGHGIGGYQSDNWLVEHCTSTNDNDSIHIDCGNTTCAAIIRYNKVYNGQPGSPNTPCMGIGNAAAGSNVQVYYNLLVNGASACFEVYGLMAGNVDYFNNTHYNAVGTGVESVFILWNGGGAANNYNIKNNIFVRDYVAGDFTYYQASGTPTTLDNNLYFIYNAVSGTLRNYYNGTTATSLAAWKTATGKEINSLSVDPLFTNINTLDFTLQSTSPARGAGVNVGLTQDIDGNSVSGSPDMGAYQFFVAPTNIVLKGRKLVIQ